MSQELAELFSQYSLEHEYTHATAASPYLYSVLKQYSQRVEQALSSGEWQTTDILNSQSFQKFIGQPTLEAITELQFKASLRQFRNFYAARLLWHDFNQSIAWKELFLLQSDLADVCMQVALEYVQLQFDQKYVRPCNADGNELILCVVAMGKWGGKELNFSSDIDYIYLFSEKGEVEKHTGSKSLSHQQYFLKQAQKINQLLDDVTEDGFVYRCDTRLRPFGDSGPLVISLAALEQYLFQHGREWERYAYLKARCITGDDDVVAGFSELRRPFVYRRYLDYGVFANLREMHEQISHQVKQKQIIDDIKLGRGGIRECEFLVQSYQLIRGGQEKNLQESNFFSAYCELKKTAVLEDKEEQFIQAYRFHRLLENRLQALNQEQTHCLPSLEKDKHALLQAMRLNSWDALIQVWDRHRSYVSHKFEQHIRLFKAENEKASFSVLLTQAVEKISDRIVKSEQFREDFSEFAQSRFYLRLKDASKRLVDQVLVTYYQLLNQGLSEHTINDDTVNDINVRFLRVIKAIGQRKTYFNLLAENHLVLENLVRTCSTSEFISLKISEHPVLLDELLDLNIFTDFPTMESIRFDVKKISSNRLNLNSEEFLQKLLSVKNAIVFRIAVAESVAGLSLMQVSDCLTTLAESILESVLDFVNHELVKKYSFSDIDWRLTGFSVLAYGKLGGLELAYSSDLDIVFLFGEHAVPKEHPLAKDDTLLGQYYHRLAQQCIRILDMPTISGRLYEVDTRLRPNGYSGFLVSSVAAFSHYQKQDAWTWEHQALLRARPILGLERIRNNLVEIRKNILCKYVRRDDLAMDVIAMRDKMRTELDRMSSADLFHLKHSKGGMIDIEFLVQYLVLVNSNKYVNLCKYTDNVRQLDAMAEASDGSAKIMHNDEIIALKEAYLALRKLAHQTGLDNTAAVIPYIQIKKEAELVIKLWNKYLLSRN